MRRWLVALALVASSLTAGAQGLRGGPLGRPAADYAYIPAPTPCASGLVPYFDASLKLVCSPTVYAPSTDTTTSTGTIAARNFTATALATPTVTSVTPTLTRVGTINVVAGASLADGDYFTVDYGSGTIPIEFEATPPNGTTGGRIPFTFAAGDAAGTIRNGLIALINLAAPTKVVASIGGAAAITVSMVTPGEAGGVITENVENAGFTVAGFANPTAATTYGYKAVSYLADGTSTAASTEVTTAAGHATLSASNFNTVVFAPSAGSTSTRLYRTTGGTGPPRLLYTGTATSYVDTGAAGTAQTPATSNGTGVVTAAKIATVATINYAGWALTGLGNVVPAINISTGNLDAANRNWAIVPNVSRFGALEFTQSAALGGDATGVGALLRLRIDSDGLALGGTAAFTPDLFLTRAAAATLQLGAANAASPVAQTLKVQDATGSNANGAASFTVKGPAGRGTGTRGIIDFQAAQAAASGDNAQTHASRLKIKELTVALPSLPVYADNTAALAGSLVAGDVYRTSTGVLMVTY